MLVVPGPGLVVHACGTRAEKAEKRFLSLLTDWSSVFGQFQSII